MKKKRFLSLLTALVLIIGTLSINVSAAPAQAEVNSEIKATAEYLAANTPISSIDISSFNKVLLFQLSGISNADAYVTAFTNSVIANNLSSDGKILISGSESLLGYTYVLQVLARAGIDATNFNGHNLIASFEACLNTYDETSLKAMIESDYMQYRYADLMYTITGYASELSNADVYKEMIKNIILSYYVPDTTYGYGLDLWGWGTYSSDDAAYVLTSLKEYYNTDAEVKEKIDASIAYVKTLIQPDGSLLLDYSYGGTPDIRPSSSETALGLVFLSAFNDSSAELVYTGLSAFKSPTTPGAYFSNPIDSDDDPGYSTKDALFGLNTYSRMLSKNLTAYDLTDTPVATYTTVIQKINALPATITLNDKAALDEIAVLYNNLTDVFKAKVTNYNIYQTALAAYQAAYNAANPVNNSSTQPQIPKTYDHSAIYLFEILLISSFAAILFSYKRKKVNN